MKKTFGPISVDEVKAGFKAEKGIHDAQIRQTVTTEYPSAIIGNSLMQGGLFAENEFELPAGKTFDSIRVTWIPVPAGTTVEAVAARLAALPNARIGQILSHKLEDVLTAEQKAAVDVGLTTMEVLRESHTVRDRDNNVVTPLQYKSTFFAANAVEDIDLRPQTTELVSQAPAQVNALQAAATTNALETLTV